MNQVFRKVLISQIRKMIEDSKTANENKHPYLKGKARELLLDNLITPLLNKNYSTGTGQIFDYNGDQSKETDICIYSNTSIPPLFNSMSEKVGLFAIESVLKCIEVKSSFSLKNLKDAYTRFKYLNENLTLTSGHHSSDGNPVTHAYSNISYDFFAFNSDTKSYNAEYILKQYKKVDPNWNNNPIITSICILGKGWICFTARGWYHMSYNKKESINEEVIGYLCALLHELDDKRLSRGSSRIGYYLTNPYKMDKIVNGKKIKNTWLENKIIFSNRLQGGS